MENFYLNDVVAEVAASGCGRILRRVWQAGDILFFDLGLNRGLRDVLVAALDPSSPMLFLYRPSSKEDAVKLPVSHANETTSPFLLFLKNRITGARLAGVTKPRLERVFTLRFEDGPDIARPSCSLVVRLTGRSSNALVVGENGRAEMSFKKPAPASPDMDLAESASASFDPVAVQRAVRNDATVESILSEWFSAKSPFGPLMKAEFVARAALQNPALAFQTLIRDLFQNPHTPLVYSKGAFESLAVRPLKAGRDLILAPFPLTCATGMSPVAFSSFSAAATEYWLALERSRDIAGRFQSLSASLSARLKGLRSAFEKVEADLHRFQDPERFKRLGDLILANLATSAIENGKIRLKDYYVFEGPEIEIDAGDARTLQEAASFYYQQYRKGRRTQEMLTPRRDRLKSEITTLESLIAQLNTSPSLDVLNRVASRFKGTSGAKPRAAPVTGAKKRDKRKGQIGRRFLSSDGYEILVGRNDSENDSMTFRIAGPQDIWLHAADYPGSHVVVRNPTRKPVPHRAILEAAEVAAFYSQAKQQAKAAVNYTQKKFVTKPPKAKPGLVRLSSFKTVMVQPKLGVCRNKPDEFLLKSGEEGL